MRFFLHSLFVCLCAITIAGICEAGKLEFVPAEITTGSGRKMTKNLAKLKVPENRTNPASRMIELAVVKLDSKSANPAPPVVYLAGGPGGSSIGEAGLPWMQELFGKLQETRDVILMDQRGTGQSTPLLYWKSPSPLPPDAFLSEEKLHSYYSESSRKARDYFREQGFDLTGYNTVESAHDLEDLRIGLGVEKISLIGYSYGTHLALATLRLHPDSIESAVLVGCEGPNHTQKLPQTYDAQLRKISDLAARHPEVGKQVPDMFALVKKILAKMEKSPVTIPVQDKSNGKTVNVQIGKFGMQLIIRMDVGDGNDFPEFPALFYTIDQGDYSLLTKYVEKRYNQFGRGISGMSTMMDLMSGVTKERKAQIEKELPDSILQNTVNLLDNMVEEWGNADLGDSYRSPIHSTVRTLFVSGTMDSNTPPYQAEEVRWGFPFSSHIIVDYAGHEDYLPNESVRAAIVDFLAGKDVNSIHISLGLPQFKPIPRPYQR